MSYECANCLKSINVPEGEFPDPDKLACSFGCMIKLKSCDWGGCSGDAEVRIQYKSGEVRRMCEKHAAREDIE